MNIYCREFSYQWMNDESVFVILNVNNCQVNRPDIFHIPIMGGIFTFTFTILLTCEMRAWSQGLQVISLASVSLLVTHHTVTTVQLTFILCSPNVQSSSLSVSLCVCLSLCLLNFLSFQLLPISTQGDLNFRRNMISFIF